MRLFPNMTCLAPADELDVEPMLQWALAQPGPTSIRYPRANAEILPRQTSTPQAIERGKAEVLLEGEEVGYTPVGIDFNHYGTREITLIKDGYETVTAMQKVRSPWYQKLPLDFVSDNFSPVKINDRLDYTFTLNKQELVSNDQLLQRAKGLRSQSQVLPKQPE